MYVAFRAIALFMGVVLLTACVSVSTGTSERDVSGLPELTICGSRVCLDDTPVEHLTPEQVQAAMRQLPGYTDTVMQQLWSDGDTVLYGWRPPDRRHVRLVMRKGNAIVFSRGLEDRVTLGKAIDQLGTPSYVLVRKAANPVALMVSASVFYPAQGLMLHVTTTQGSSQFDLTPDLRLSSYTLTSSQELGAMFASALFPLYGPPDPSREATGNAVVPLIQPWRGYGRYEVSKEP